MMINACAVGKYTSPMNPKGCGAIVIVALTVFHPFDVNPTLFRFFKGKRLTFILMTVLLGLK